MNLDRNPMLIDKFDGKVKLSDSPLNIKAMLIVGKGKIILENKNGYELYRQSAEYSSLPNVSFKQGVFVSENSDTEKIEKVLIYL